jgi:hypothetical protein
MRKKEDNEAAIIREQLKRKLDLDIKPMLASDDIFNDPKETKEVEDLF